MESTLQLEIVTPDKVVVSQTVDYVGVPGIEGEFGVLPHHIALLSALAIGDLYFRVDGKTEHVFVSGGFAEVSDNKLSILAESAERGEDIDTARANAARERARQDCRNGYAPGASCSPACCGAVAHRITGLVGFVLRLKGAGLRLRAFCLVLS